MDMDTSTASTSSRPWDADQNSPDKAETSDQVNKKRQRTGPFKRSKTGCATCKRRGKKCDEDWSQAGKCQRCLKGHWDCTGRTEGLPPRSRSKGSSTPTLAGRNGTETTQTQTQTVRPVDVEPPASFRTPSVPITQESSSLGPAPLPEVEVSPTAWLNATPESSTMGATRLPMTNNAQTTAPTLTGPLSSSTLGSLPDSVSAMQNWPNYFNLDFAGLLDQSSMFSTNKQPQSNSVTLDWATRMSPLSSWTPNLQAPDTWTQFSHLFAPTPGGSSSADEDVAAQLTFGNNTNGNQVLNDASRVVILNGNDRPTRRGVSLAEIYARVVESWLVGIPSTARDYARTRIMSLNDNNSVMRAVRYAVAIAYIFLYASDPQGIRTPQPRLVEMAYRGAGVLNDLSPPNDAGNDSMEPVQQQNGNGSRSRIGRRESNVRGSDKHPTRGEMAKKLRLYVDHVTIPFSSDEESSRWTDAAVKELRQVVVTGTTQLSDLLWGVIDLQLVEFIKGGAAPSYSMLALGDRLVQSAFGESHPPLSFSRLRSSESFSLRLYAISDISRCIVHRGRRTLFRWTDDMPNLSGTVATSEDEPWDSYLGLPDTIVLLLAKVVNLCADMVASSKPNIQSRAEALETEIKNWQPSQSPSAGGGDATAIVSRTIAGQLWRLCALILLYQSVHQVGSLHPKLRHARSETLSLLESIVRLPNGDLWGFIGLPAFLAATLSITETDRQKAMQHMLRPGPERMWLDNVALVEKVWEEVDETGRPVDWYDKLQREGMSVAFF